MWGQEKRKKKKRGKKEKRMGQKISLKKPNMNHKAKPRLHVEYSALSFVGNRDWNYVLVGKEIFCRALHVSHGDLAPGRRLHLISFFWVVFARAIIVLVRLSAGRYTNCACVYGTLFALPGNCIFLSALKLDICGLLYAIDFRQPFIFATSGSSFSISCVCPSFHVDSQVNYMKPTWKQGRAFENAEKGPPGHRDL